MGEHHGDEYLWKNIGEHAISWSDVRIDIEERTFEENEMILTRDNLSNNCQRRRRGRDVVAASDSFYQEGYESLVDAERHVLLVCSNIVAL